MLPTERRLENVAIAMHCNLRLPDAAPVPVRFNFVAHAKFEVAQPIRCHLIPLLLLIPQTLKVNGSKVKVIA